MKYKLTGFADEAADDIRGQVSVLKELGWSAIELRAVDSTLAHDLSEDAFDEVLAVLEAEEISVACLGSGIASWAKPLAEPFEVTKETTKRAIKRMKRLNTDLVRIMSYQVIQDESGRIDADQQLEERFMRLNWIVQSFLDAGLTPVHENCHTWGGLSADHTLEMIDKVPGMKLVFDTGNPPITVDGRGEYPYEAQDTFAFYKAVRDHIEHIHIKDARWEGPDRKELYFYPGEGDGAVREVVKDLIETGYDGYYSMEPHMEVVFHDDSAVSSVDSRRANFIKYGKTFEQILADVTAK